MKIATHAHLTAARAHPAAMPYARAVKIQPPAIATAALAAMACAAPAQKIAATAHLTAVHAAQLAVTSSAMAAQVKLAMHAQVIATLATSALSLHDR